MPYKSICLATGIYSIFLKVHNFLECMHVNESPAHSTAYNLDASAFLALVTSLRTMVHNIFTPMTPLF
jgi:hypothetical protein